MKSLHDFNDARVVQWLRRLTQHGFTVQHIWDSTNCSSCRRCIGQALLSATAVICDGYRSSSTLPLSFSLDTHAAVIPANINN